MVIKLGVGEDRDLRGELEQRAVGLVGLDDDPLTAPPSGVQARIPQLAADDVRRVEPAAAEHVNDHPRRRRLAVRAGDRDASLQRRDLGEQVGAVQFLAMRRLAFRVLRGDRRRVHDLGVVRDIRGRVADRRRDSVLAEPIGVGGLAPVGPGHVRAERLRDKREAAHARAADPDEMEAA